MKHKEVKPFTVERRKIKWDNGKNIDRYIREPYIKGAQPVYRKDKAEHLSYKGSTSRIYRWGA